MRTESENIYLVDLWLSALWALNLIFYTRKRSWSGRGGWLSRRGSAPGAMTLARGRRRLTASLGTSVGKDETSRSYLNLQVAGEGHEDQVQEQQLADPGHHCEDDDLGHAADVYSR